MKTEIERPRHGSSANAVLPSLLNITAHVDHRFGGLTTSLPHFCEAVEATGRYRAELAAFCEPDESHAGSPEPAIFPFGRLRWLFDSALRGRLAGLIRAADAVHIHGIWQEQCAVAAALARSSRTPYLVAAHGMLEPWAFKSKGWKKRIYWELFEKGRLAGASCLRALTAAEGEQYRGLGLRGPIAVIPNGVSIPDAISSAPFFSRFPELRGKKLLLFLGRIHHKKGIRMLCETWARICGEFPDAHLVMAGPDPDGNQPELEALLKQAGAGAQVTFTGMLRGEEKWGALAASTVFLLPSYSEGFSMAVLEALGSGLPAILSKQCYFPEVEKYNCGWVIDPEPGALKETMRQCLESGAAEHSRKAAQARRLIAERFSWPVIGDATVAVLDWMVGGGAAPPCVEILA
jgi:glycosyltransferase involved in cell wall biosynthesis